MSYVATNETKADIAFRDNAGKHIIPPAESVNIAGNQHADAARIAGLTVREQTADDIPPEPVSPTEAADIPRIIPDGDDKPERSAKVSARD